MSSDIISEFEKRQLPFIVLSGRVFKCHTVFAMYAPFTYSSIPNCCFPLLTLYEKMHNAFLQLDVCNFGTHTSCNKVGHLNIWFPIPAEQAGTEEYITLRKLEFEHLENPDPEESALDEEIPKVDREQQSLILSGPLLCT